MVVFPEDAVLRLRYDGAAIYPLALFLMPIHTPDHEPEDFVYLDFVEPLEDVDIKDAPNIKDAPDE